MIYNNDGYSFLYNNVKDHFNNDPFVNVFAEGQGDEIDLSKQTIFPLSYMTIETASPDENAVQITFNIYAMDIIDIKDDANDNKHDVMNTQYNVLLRFYEMLRRGGLYDKKMQLVSMSMNAFEQRFANYLAGWSASVTVYIPNHMTIC